jgi:uncharacterized protein YjbI with pentapeptide repeats
MDRPSSYWNRALTFVKQNRFLTFVITVGAVVVAIVVRDLFAVFVRGYAWKPGTGFTGQTLWEWMQLLIIPAVLAFGAYLFSRYERENDRKIAEDRQREVALQTYLDRMTELLLDGELRKSGEDSEVRAVARARTLTVLRLLDGERKGALIRFLQESNLIDVEKNVIDLKGADLRRADLRGAFLKQTCLRGADLTEANLCSARLEKADLSEADLSRVRLRSANLVGANLGNSGLVEADLSRALLSGANLRESDLIKANLRWSIMASIWMHDYDSDGPDIELDTDLAWADLRGADLSMAEISRVNFAKANLHDAIVNKEQLSKVSSLKGAIMPDGTVHE